MKKNILVLIAAAALTAGCTQSVQTVSQKFNELPPAVQKTVRAQAPNSEIIAVAKTTDQGREVYQVEFSQPGHTPNPKVIVAIDGTLIRSDMPNPPSAIERMLTPTGATGTSYSALPELVQKAIQSQAPDAQIASITRHESNGRVIYEIAFKDQGKNPTIRVADDGTLVQSLQK
jgi:uncharacterized membrane protein YkoI